MSELSWLPEELWIEERPLWDSEETIPYIEWWITHKEWVGLQEAYQQQYQVLVLSYPRFAQTEIGKHMYITEEPHTCHIKLVCANFFKSFELGVVDLHEIECKVDKKVLTMMRPDGKVFCGEGPQ